MHVVARGALIGGGVGAVLAIARRPAKGEADPGKRGRMVKSAAEGAVAGAVVGFFLDRSLRRTAADLLVTNAPVVIDAVTEFAQRYEPAIERLAEAALERATDAYTAARPVVEDAVDAVRARATELRAA